jgi:hypothetical protein
MFWCYERTLRQLNNCVALVSDKESLVLDINRKTDKAIIVNLQNLLAFDT